MAINFKIQDYKDGKLIQLSSRYGRPKILNFFYALIFFTTAIGFCKLLVAGWDTSNAATLILLLAIVAYAMIFYRFINKATEVEKVFVNKQRLDIIASRMLKTDKQSFLLTDISHFRFLDKERYAPHPLRGETIDYLGFQTEQEVIQDLHSEGRASFIYHGREVRFGKELASWEFEELEVLFVEVQI